MMRADLLRPESPAWRSLLDEAPHDFYHLPSYVAMTAAQERSEAAAILVEDGARAMLVPILMRDVPGVGARDATCPYGYPGPVVRGGDADPAFVEAAARAVVERLAREGLVSFFGRLHPLLNRDASPYARVGAIVEHGETVSIDLTRTLDELWSGTQSGHRNEINRALRAGHRAYFDEAWRHEERFVALYLETMRRVDAGAYYMFGLDYLRALREALGPRLHLCVVDIGGVVAAAGLFVETSGIVEYHLSGSDEAYARERPTKLMLHHVRTTMKERGNRVMHLGGGLGGAADSLFRFKAGFSKERQPFRTWRVVCDAERYRALTAARHPSAAELDAADASGFFPAYRRP